LASPSREDNRAVKHDLGALELRAEGRTVNATADGRTVGVLPPAQGVVRLRPPVPLRLRQGDGPKSSSGLAAIGSSRQAQKEETQMAERRLGGISVGGILVIAGLLIMFIWSFWIGLVVALIGLVAFGGFVRGKWY
jgi:hypothetical protein